MMIINTLPPEVVSGFDLEGSLFESRPYGSGHINDTFLACFQTNGSRFRYIFQRINHHVFADPIAVMENIQRVTAEQRRKLTESGSPDVFRRALNLVPTTDGSPCLVTEDRNYWRCYHFIERARTYNVTQGPDQAFAAARAFGDFREQMGSIPGHPLHVTIPGFHDTRSRFERLREVAAITGRETPPGSHPAPVSTRQEPRALIESAAAEWAFIREREAWVDVLLDLHARGEIAERVTHNDTKLNNVMIDDFTGEGICVIDLDTVMPGLALYDFGDLVRSTASHSPEDDTDPEGAKIEIPLFEALVRGYLSGNGESLNEAEKAHLVFSGKLIALEAGMRFLTDFLEGDIYFKTAYPGQNLDRCRKQLAMVRSIEDQEAAMLRIVDRF